MNHPVASMTKEEFAQWNERMAHVYNPDLYHRSANRIVRWVEGKRVARLMRLLDVRPEHRVLEVGVGAGNILERVHARERVGIDLSAFLLSTARARLGEKATLIEGDAETLDRYVSPGMFDRVYCSEVLEHVRNPALVLKGMADCLTDDGVAVVSVPNERCINVLKSFFKTCGLFHFLFPRLADHMEDEWHVHVLGRKMLGDLCGQHFVIDRIDAVPSALLPIRLVARLRPKLARKHLSALVRPDVPCEDVHGVCTYRSAHDRMAADAHAAPIERDWKTPFKRFPRLYNLLFALIGPSLLTGETSARFVRGLADARSILHAGSGPRFLDARCVNIDIVPFPGVDVVADLHAMPFRDGVFDAVTCEQVLEHVASPVQVAQELVRVTKTGGLIHIAAPFMFPWHPSPSDYTRWTLQGLRTLFPDCAVVRQGVMAGPFSALNAFIPAFLATLLCFGSRRLQTGLQYVFLVLFAPMKLFDIVFAHIPGAELCAANFYVVMRKR